MIYELYIYIYKVMLATILKVDLKAPFSIATIPRSRERHYFFPWIAPFYPEDIPCNTES